MKSVLKYFFYIFITRFALTATAQNKYNFSKKFTTEEKQEVNQLSSSLANQNPSSTAEETSGPCPVGEPSNPNPPDGAIDIPLSYPNLSWTNGSGATSIEVIFDGGTIYSGAPVTSIPMPPMNYVTTYSWKVNGSNDTCTTFGPTWTFTTLSNPGIICLFMDDFENGDDNWTITTVSGCPWAIFPASDYTLPPTATGNCMAADADACGSGGGGSTGTITLINAIDLGFHSTIWIEFDNDWWSIDNEDTAKVEISVDGGFAWQTVLIFDEFDVRSTHEIWDISSIAAFQPSVLLRFVSIQPGWDWWWAIDNVAVYATDCLGCIYPPTDLTAIAEYANGSSVLLNWVDNSALDDTIHIERKLGSIGSTNEFSEIATIESNTTSYTDYTVADTTMYTYRVRASNIFGSYSPYSNLAEVMTIIPVELTSFTATVFSNSVLLKWSTATKTNNLGFEIYRTNHNDEQSWKKIGFVQGQGTTTEPQSYSFMDESILSGTYQYKLKQMDYDGSYEYSNIIEVEVGIPTEFSLEQNYPNPFNPTTIIKFTISDLPAGKVYDLRF